MSDFEWDDSATGQEPGADVGDDGDVPDNPLLGDEPTLGPEEPVSGELG